MAGQESRYDRIAEGYATYWSPVHRAATLHLLDEVDPLVGSAATRVLDVGCGTGALAVAAVRRWATIEVEAADISTGMLAVAARTLAEAGEAGRRVHLVHAPADRLPFADGTFDLVLTAFVLQLVPSRPRTLREMRRVLQPGGRLAFVGWLAGELPFAADAAWEAALDSAGVERESSGGHDDLASPTAAANQLRAAGFWGVTAREDRLVHQFTPEAYAAFVTQFDDGDLLLSLAPEVRDALAADLLARLRRLDPADLRLELPIVYSSGIRR